MTAQDEAEKLDQEVDAGRSELQEALTQLNEKVGAKVEAVESAVESMMRPLAMVKRNPLRSLVVAFALGVIVRLMTGKPLTKSAVQSQGR